MTELRGGAARRYPISDGDLLNLAIQAGLNPNEVHPAQHENFGWCTFAKLVMDAALSSPPAPSAGAILETMREHHNWHLQAGTIGLQDGDGGWIEIDNGAEYSDSALYERTAKLLEGAPAEELQPIPRGGMNTWWWEQAVLLRRKVRALEKAAQATSAGMGADEIAFFQAVADGYSGKIEHGCLIVENPKADPQSLALGGVSPNLVLDANAILALLSRAGDQK